MSPSNQPADPLDANLDDLFQYHPHLVDICGIQYAMINLAAKEFARAIQIACPSENFLAQQAMALVISAKMLANQSITMNALNNQRQSEDID